MRTNENHSLGYIALNSTPPYDHMDFRFSNVFTQQQTADFIPRPEKEMAGKQTSYVCVCVGDAEKL